MERHGVPEGVVGSYMYRFRGSIDLVRAPGIPTARWDKNEGMTGGVVLEVQDQNRMLSRQRGIMRDLRVDSPGCFSKS